MNWIYTIIFFIICIFASGHAHDDKPIHILMVLDTFPCDTKTIIMNQAIGLSQKGFIVSVAAKYKGSIINETELYKFFHNVYWGPIDENYLQNADVIICQYGSIGKECAQYIKKKHTQKLITFFRGADITAIQQTQHGEYNQLFTIGDLFLPVCSYFAYLLEILGCDKNKIIVQPSGIDCCTFKFRKNIRSKSSDSINIISVGRLIEKKGYEYTLKAVAKLINSGYNIYYTIVGDGKRKNELIRLTKNLKITNHVQFIGHQSNAKVAHLLAQSHIFVLPSVTCADGSQEGIPNAVKEAMAMGLPVISTYHAGMRELIQHGESGFLVPERDVESLAKHIKYLIDHPEKWETITKNARIKIESSYDMHYLNTIFEKHILDLIFSTPIKE